MKNLWLINKSKIIPDKEQHNTAIYEIEIVNLARIRIMLGILFIIELMFIVFNDIPYYFHLGTEVIWRDHRYFILHLLLSATAVIGFVIARMLINTDEGKWKRVYSYFTPVILVTYLTLISLLSGLDQSYNKNISSIFISNLLICGGVFMMRFPKNLLTYVIPCFSYIGTFVYFGFEKVVLYSNFINCIIFLFAIIIISTIIYDYQYDGIVRNIILDQTNYQLNYISSYDSLTGLLNRRYFMEQIEKIQVGNKESAAVILLDVDYFKIVNDKFGHPVGDMVLKEVSFVLKKYIKEEDLAVRWGGEEFLLFLYNISPEEAYILAEKIRKAIERLTINVNGFMIQTTASFGVAYMEYVSDITFSNAYKAADKALYKAKDQGRNCVVEAEV